MSPTITKRADELKPGDVWVIGHCRYSLLAIMDAEDAVEITYCGLPRENEESRLRERTTRKHDAEFEIESPALSLAQQHAEEMLELLRDYGRGDPAGWERKVLDLLTRLRPPAPPTLEEALESVRALYSMGRDGDPEVLESAGKLLARARRAGSLK